MRHLHLIFFLSISNFLFSQYTEELVEIDYENDQLISIKVLDQDYPDQVLGGVVVNTDDNYYSFTDSDSKIYTFDIANGELKFAVDLPQIQMLQFQPGSKDFIGISKGNPSGEVAIATVNFETGAFNNFPILTILENINIDAHNSAIDPENNILYFIGSSISSNTNWSFFAVNTLDGTLIKTFDLSPDGEYLNGLAFDSDRQRLLGIMELTANGRSLVEVDPENETITEIKKLPEISNTFGGHRYWAYDDVGDKYFIIGLDPMNESFLYVLNSITGDILFQNPYEDDAWIMEEHSPLELRYSPNTQQLLGLRKGPPLPPVSTLNLSQNQEDFKLFPNPVANDFLNVKLENGALINSISLFSIDGKVLLEKNEVNSNTFGFNVIHLKSGGYYILATSPKGVYRKPFIVP